MGSKKKSTIGHRYYTSVHMVLGAGPWDSIYQIRYGGKVAWRGGISAGDLTIAAPALFGGDSGEGGIAGVVEVLPGDRSQPINAHLAAYQGAVSPAYRGVESLVFKNMYWGNSPYYKPVRVLGSRIHTPLDGASEREGDGGGSQWYPEAAAIANNWNAPAYVYIALDVSGSMDAATFGVARGGVYDLLVSLEGQYIQGKIVAYSNAAGVNDSIEFGFGSVGGALAWLGGLAPDADPAVVPDAAYALAPMESFFPPRMPAQNRAIIIAGGVLANAEAAAATYAEFLDWFNTPYSFGSGDAVYLMGWGVGAIRNLPLVTNWGAQVAAADAAAFAAQIEFAIALEERPIFYDMNPAHIVREVLTSVIHGKGADPNSIDDISFRAAADTFFAESFGISCFWSGEQDADQFIDGVLQVADARLYIHPRTGLWTLKPIRADYDVGALPVLGPSDIRKVENYKRPQPEELPNSVSVTYWDISEESVATVMNDDPAMVAQAGQIKSISRDYTGHVTSANLALRLAQRDRLVAGSPLLTATLTCMRANASELMPGDAFLFVWPQYHDGAIIMRVRSTRRGGLLSNRVIIEAVEDVFTLEDGINDFGVAPPLWSDPTRAPLAPPVTLAVEAPYWELVQRFGESQTDDLLGRAPDAGMVLATASYRDNAVFARIFEGGDEWPLTADLCNTGVLLEDVPRGDMEMRIQWVRTPTAGEHFQLGDELLVFYSIDGDGNTVAGRGVLDTVPVEVHAAGATAWAWDSAAVTNEIEHAGGESITLRASVANQSQESAQGMPALVTFNSRAIRPYPPGRLRFNDDPLPASLPFEDVIVTWAHRDRLTQTAGGDIVNTIEGSIGPEPGTTYNIRVYSNDSESALLLEVTGLTGTSYTMTPGSEWAAGVVFELESERDGYVSWQKHSIELVFSS